MELEPPQNNNLQHTDLIKEIYELTHEIQVKQARLDELKAQAVDAKLL